MASNRTRAAMRWLAVAATAAVLASCVVVEPGPGSGPWPPSSDGPQFCTREYDPVCARDGRERRTFSNACEARSEGYRVLYEGQCRRADPGPGGGGDEPRFCTREYRPVCGANGRQIRTFGNACEADAAGYRIIRQRPC